MSKKANLVVFTEILYFFLLVLIMNNLCKVKLVLNKFSMRLHTNLKLMPQKYKIILKYLK